MSNEICIDIETAGHNLFQHHVKYKEIHGVDETVQLTWSEHQKLHARLRREGKCQIPSDELHKIVVRAYQRTEKGKQALKRNSNSVKGKQTKQKNNRLWRKRRFDFLTVIEKDVGLVESIFELNSGIGVYSRFRGYHGIKLKAIDKRYS